VIDQCKCASNLLFLHSLLILFFDDFWRRMQMFRYFWTGVLNDFGTLRLASSDTRRLLTPSGRLAPVDWRRLVGLTLLHCAAFMRPCALTDTCCSENFWNWIKSTESSTALNWFVPDRIRRQCYDQIGPPRQSDIFKFWKILEWPKAPLWQFAKIWVHRKSSSWLDAPLVWNLHFAIVIIHFLEISR